MEENEMHFHHWMHFYFWNEQNTVKATKNIYAIYGDGIIVESIVYK